MRILDQGVMAITFGQIAELICMWSHAGVLRGLFLSILIGVDWCMQICLSCGAPEENSRPTCAKCGAQLPQLSGPFSTRRAVGLYLEDSPLLSLDGCLVQHCVQLRQGRTTWGEVLAWLGRHVEYVRELYDEITVMVLGLHRGEPVDDAGGALGAIDQALAALAEVRSALQRQSMTLLEEALGNLKPALQELRRMLRSEDESDEGGSRVPTHPRPPTRPAGEARARPTFIDDGQGEWGGA